MLISLNKIKEYVKIDIPTDELIRLIGSRLVEVEGSIDLAPKYRGIKIVKVISAESIPETHLHLCQVNAGEGGEVQVVCGAPNVHTGMLAAWIMPGSIVPSTYGGEDFKLSVRKLRGYESHGMLAAADELDLGTDHDGIIEIDPKMSITMKDGSIRPVQPGDDFATAFDLNDIILDIENKSLTHRPDCFGLIGFAREVAGILGQKFEEGEMFALADTVSARANIDDEPRNARPLGRELPKANGREEERSAKVNISISDANLCPRYSCAVLDCTKLLEKGKYFTRDDAFLAKSGMRGISPIVDLTNILMLETGQPLHAFDYDKFVQVGGAKTPQVLVRPAQPGEKLQLLDGKTIECVDTDILITSSGTPVALAGAMGGASTEIDASSTKIILESATFSLYNLRKTQMAHGIFSEAITRFTKGQPASQTLPVLEEAIRRLGTAPLAVSDCYPAPAQPIVVKITTSEINNLLGTAYDAGIIQKTLENVGFEVRNVAPGALELTAPLWRTDIHIKEDLIEEVGRLLGFDNIPISLPQKPFSGTAKNPLWQLKTELRSILSGQLGAHELLTYSFVSEDLLTKVGEDPQNSYKIINSISPELQYFRQTLTPSLLDKIYQNLKAGHEHFTLYEINQISVKREPLDTDKVPVTHTHLSIVTFGDFYKIKQFATRLASALRIQPSLKPAGKSLPGYFEPAHSAAISLPGASALGHYGAIRKSVLRKFKLDNYEIAALEWDLGPILATPQAPITLPALAFSKFPIVSRDLTFKTPASITYQTVQDAIANALAEENLIHHLAPISIYQPENTAARNLSFHLDFADPARTLASDEISAIIERIVSKVTALGVEAV